MSNTQPTTDPTRTAEHNFTMEHGDGEWLAKGDGCAICDAFHAAAAFAKHPYVPRPAHLRSSHELGLHAVNVELFGSLGCEGCKAHDAPTCAQCGHMHTVDTIRADCGPCATCATMWRTPHASGATDADECAMIRERSVAGISDEIPTCQACGQ